MNKVDFATAFEALTGNPPFPWQQELYKRFISDRPDNIPDSSNLPTGLGKTSVIAIWLLALATAPTGKVPRRLVYVVNRRTVVDQSTDEARKLRDVLVGAFGPPTQIQMEIATALAKLSADPHGLPLAISTLRGQFADNREWSSNPTRPAVIAGTVDMIGSRLLFSGYGVGFKMKPLHAGFLGQDALLVHDEAHLEPAFQALIEAIACEQRGGQLDDRDQGVDQGRRRTDFRPFRVMALTATHRGGGEAFELTPAEKAGEVPVVRDRLFAKKGIKPVDAERSKLALEIGRLSLRHKDSDKAVVIFVRTIEDVNTVRSTLTEKNKGVPADRVQQLTGTLRGLERDDLATSDRVFARFLPDPKVIPKEDTVYLICTSAGEVGVDISADHMVSDLTPLDSMAQRLGRVNRRGGGAAEIDVVYERDPDPKKKDDPLEKARWATLARLRELPPCDWIADRHEGSPHEIGRLIRGLTEKQRTATFSPTPTVLPTSDILFDAWALTTIRDKLPGRPAVEPYLHGLSEWQPPETHVAWREEVGVITSDLREQDKPADLLEDYPLKPHELLRDSSSRVFDRLKKLKAAGGTPVWLISDDDTVEVTTLAELIDAGKEEIERKTILLPPSAGGLENGMLTGNPEPADDVADELFEEKGNRRRVRVWDDDEEFDAKTENMRLIRRIDLPAGGEDEDTEGRSWHWFELPKDGDTDGSKANKKPVLWEVHTKDVTDNATAYLANLPLPQGLKDAIILAAKCHDFGKRRKLFQTILGNFKYPDKVLAKSGKKGGRVPELYRHEFGSLVNVLDESRPECAELRKLSADMQDVVLHLIAVHHGYGRPHFPADRAFDPESKGQNVDSIAAAVVQRFARLQRRYGRWGLAYLESLLRAADYAASAKPSKFEEDDA
jgi:CRISPR-associated endonuclease/helicase Cas3